MKIQYTFTAELEDAQEILYQKYSRIYNRNDLESLHKRLKSAYLEKKSLKEINKILTIYKDALAAVYSEIEEEFGFISGLVEALENQGTNEEVPEQSKEKSLLTETQETTKSIQELTSMLSALGSAGNQHE
tara:strand:+ start:1380 stop:1772 length:393 start_codon:yes stop_codon:yes gene_type:complete